jgi:hypothetical protein
MKALSLTNGLDISLVQEMSDYTVNRVVFRVHIKNVTFANPHYFFDIYGNGSHNGLYRVSNKLKICGDDNRVIIDEVVDEI